MKNDKAYEPIREALQYFGFKLESKGNQNVNFYLIGLKVLAYSSSLNPNQNIEFDARLAELLNPNNFQGSDLVRKEALRYIKHNCFYSVSYCDHYLQDKKIWSAFENYLNIDQWPRDKNNNFETQYYFESKIVIQILMMTANYNQGKEVYFTNWIWNHLGSLINNKLIKLDALILIQQIIFKGNSTKDFIKGGLLKVLNSEISDMKYVESPEAMLSEAHNYSYWNPQNNFYINLPVLTICLSIVDFILKEGMVMGSYNGTNIYWQHFCGDNYE